MNSVQAAEPINSTSCQAACCPGPERCRGPCRLPRPPSRAGRATGSPPCRPWWSARRRPRATTRSPRQRSDAGVRDLGTSRLRPAYPPLLGRYRVPGQKALRSVLGRLDPAELSAAGFTHRKSLLPDEHAIPAPLMPDGGQSANSVGPTRLLLRPIRCAAGAGRSRWTASACAGQDALTAAGSRTVRDPPRRRRRRHHPRLAWDRREKSSGRGKFRPRLSQTVREDLEPGSTGSCAAVMLPRTKKCPVACDDGSSSGFQHARSRGHFRDTVFPRRGQGPRMVR